MRAGDWIRKAGIGALEVKNRREAVMMAEDLKALNDSRKEMTEKWGRAGS